MVHYKLKNQSRTLCGKLVKELNNDEDITFIEDEISCDKCKTVLFNLNSQHQEINDMKNG